MAHIFWNEYFRPLDSGAAINVLAIGDSWFHYPFNNLITPLCEALEPSGFNRIVAQCLSGPARHALWARLNHRDPENQSRTRRSQMQTRITKELA